MEIKRWPHSTYDEIPKQDNPALSPDKKECLILCRQWYNGNGRYRVIHCRNIHQQFTEDFFGPDDVAIFWDYEVADSFARAYAKNYKKK